MKYLITGGTGTFGKACTKVLLEHGNEVVIYSRDEHKQNQMRGSAPEAEYVIGDVKDADRIKEACYGVDVVIHAAALKHVSTAQNHPWEVVKTNLIGTHNVCEAAKKLVFLSTDKAVSPINTYGKTKALAEDVVLSYGFGVVRYGNVWGSRGSVIHKFRQQAEDGQFKITDHGMSRFILSVGYAIKLVLESINNQGNILVSKAKSLWIYELITAINPDVQIIETGRQPGDKFFEHLMNEYEANRAIDKGWYYLLPPDRGGGKVERDYNSFLNEKLTEGEIKELIDGAV